MKKDRSGRAQSVLVNSGLSRLVGLARSGQPVIREHFSLRIGCSVGIRLSCSVQDRSVVTGQWSPRMTRHIRDNCRLRRTTMLEAHILEDKLGATARPLAN